MKEKSHIQVQHAISEAKKGNREAFGELYDLFLDQIYRFVFVRVGSREDAEDVTEHIFLKVFTNISSYEERGYQFETWLYTIARHEIIDYYRTKKKDAPLSAALHVPDGRPTPEQAAVARLTFDELLAHIHALQPSYQEILVLKFIEDRDNTEISIILGKPVDQIRVLQQRALKKLKSIMYTHL